MKTPYIDRPNVISRYKDKRYARQFMLFGKDCDVDAASRSNGRFMYDGDMLLQGDLLVGLNNGGAERTSWLTVLIGERAGLYLSHTWNRHRPYRASSCDDRTACESTLYTRQYVLTFSQ
jgi:hypothetical protein